MQIKNSIQDGLIDSVELYQEKDWFLRYDTSPFLLFYLISTILILSGNTQLELVGFILFPVALSLHLLLFLFSQSSIRIRCFIGKKIVHDVEKATFIFVKPSKNAGKETLVQLMHSHQKNNIPLSVLGKKYPKSSEHFKYQEVTYTYVPTNSSFVRLDYPTSFSSTECLGWNGYNSQENVLAAFEQWGVNEFNIPIPHFLDLYIEHLIAPFFVFQVVCLFLWSLDDYWYYSVFSLMMLMLFEGVMCNQRQANARMMRNMRRPAFKIWAYRFNSWVETTSHILVPGDIISLTSDSHTSDSVDGKVIPCDVFLLSGSCLVNEAMLTGESTPKVKEAYEEDNEGELINLNSKSTLGRHLLMGGTSLQQHTNSSGLGPIPSPPDNGCIGVVLRTGFATTQGELMRKILFASDNVTGGNSSETFFFILALVIFALIASSFVLWEGVQDIRRNKFRLALHCIMIVTSVVPPELPMELSLSVTNSLAALSKQMIYCTEPYRIAFAGKLNVICFDKTGTLTKDEMILKGVVAGQDIDQFQALPKQAPSSSNLLTEEIVTPDLTNDFVRCILGSCHDLMLKQEQVKSKSPDTKQDSKGKVLGDPLELASLEVSGFQFISSASFSSSQSASSSTNNQQRLYNGQIGTVINIVHKFPFSSDLKRMSVIAQVVPASNLLSVLGKDMTNENSSAINYVFSKGAPEIMQQFLGKVPTNYTKVYQEHMQSGKRVLTLAYKRLPPSTLANASTSAKKSYPSSSSSSHQKTFSRSEMEKDLLFAGFLIFDCDLKPDSKGVIKDLHFGNYTVLMITGDSVFTACNVGQRLTLIDQKKESRYLTKVSIKSAKEEETLLDKLVWRKIELPANGEGYELIRDDDISFEINRLPVLSSTYNLAITGEALEYLTKDDHSALKSLKHYVSIYARVSPTQKEKVIIALNDSSYFTLMCGDGTNDVGALKAAHVGVSIINNPNLENAVETAIKQMADSNGSSGKKTKSKASSNKDRLGRALLEMQQNEYDPTMIKFGDASIASPFTAKRTSVDSILSVIRQGRCTLVTTIQVYKVLALNCLASAYMMSALYLQGLKHGDTQMTCSGLIIATLFFFLSQAKPLQTISPNHPPSHVFHKSIIISIAGQFFVHLICMFLTIELCHSHPAYLPFRMLPDGQFLPNLINTTMFILSNQIQINNFWINYRGAPFMEDLTNNIYFYRLLQGIYLGILIVVGGQFEPLNDLLQLVMLPSREFQIKFLLILVGNVASCYGIEYFSRRME